MTHDEIDQLEAGPELDAMVAELIGWKPTEYKRFVSWLVPDGRMFKTAVPGYGDYLTGDIFSPSTDWAAVGEVMDSLDDWDWQLISHGEGVTMTIFKDATHYEATAPAAPLAICRAAYKASEKGKHDYKGQGNCQSVS